MLFVDVMLMSSVSFVRVESVDVVPWMFVGCEAGVCDVRGVVEQCGEGRVRLVQAWVMRRWERRPTRLLRRSRTTYRKGRAVLGPCPKAPEIHFFGVVHVSTADCLTTVTMVMGLRLFVEFECCRRVGERCCS